MAANDEHTSILSAAQAQSSTNLRRMTAKRSTNG